MKNSEGSIKKDKRKDVNQSKEDTRFARDDHSYLES